MLDWNDLRYFLAVARSGSTLAASKQLKVSQSTVSRRITALEEELDVKLFVRRPVGYDLTPRGQSVLPAAEQVEAAMLAFSDGVDAETRRLTGKVRVSTVEAAGNRWVIPSIALLREEHPNIQIELLTSDHYVDLARGEADFAIRFGQRPTEETLIVRHLFDMLESFYASQTLVDRFGLPMTVEDLARYPMIASTSPDGFANVWLAENVPDVEIAQRTNSMSSVMASVQSGLGAAMMPCIMGDADPSLVRLLEPIEELTTPGWMVTTDIARRQPHIRVVIDTVVQQIQTTLAQSPVQAPTSKAA
ncbi:MAG: LysR family transcriptional regulator [Erythrobacter sp.]|nr:LysR family transcriptional regulator [Erythrobacter sp.]